MNFRNFLLISIILHILILAVLFFAIKNRREAQGAPMVATLISPENMVKPPPKPLLRKTPRTPPQRLRPFRMRPLPPPTRRELEHMPISAVPRTAGRKGPESQKQFAKKAQPAARPPRPARAGNKGGASASRTPAAPALEAAAPKAASKAPRPGTPGTGATIGRRELFDQSVINRMVAKNDVPAGKGRSGSKGAITFDTHDFRYWGYMQRLKEKIESIWVYPRQAIERRLYGELEIRFTILKDGTLGDVRIVRTSGYPILDEAALRALRDGQPYWPLPDEWGRKSFTVDGHFLYTFSGYGIE